MKRSLFNILAGLSLFLCVVACVEEGLRFPDNDFSFYWASKGRMISVDTFEDTHKANAITIRRFSPMPSDVSFHFRWCSVEGGDDAPTLGVGNSAAVWVDRNNQPVGPHDAGAVSKPMNVSVLAQISLGSAGWFIFVTGFIPALLVGVRYRSCRKRQKRQMSNLCAACAYDLRATPDRCPECGAIPKMLVKL